MKALAGFGRWSAALMEGATSAAQHSCAMRLLCCRCLRRAAFASHTRVLLDPPTCRRTAFVYELEDPDAPDVPTTLRRSKDDCPKASAFAHC